MTIHVVRAGESVGSIAAYYGVDPARLAADNEVPDSAALAGDFVCACLAQARKSSPFGAEFENSLLFLGESARRRRN